eukprot:XP_011681277.1 PREDICTED: nuclear receptor coactivator 5 isoform X2 [Strongylocentrotus purpuratus]
MGEEIKINLGSRVFVANLPTEQMDKEELIKRFEKYGRISNTFMKKGFAFIQFGSPQEAQDAIRTESGQILYGKKIECSLAKRKPGEDKPGGERGGGGPAGNNVSNSTAAILAREKGDQDRYPSSGGPQGGYDDFYRDKYRDGPQGRDSMLGRDGPHGRDGPNGRDGPHGRDGMPGRDSMLGRDGPNGRDGPHGRDGMPGRDFPPRMRERSPIRDRERDRYDDRYRDSYFRDDPARRDLDRYPDDRRDPYDRALPPLPPRDRDRDRDVRDRDLRDPLRDPLREPMRDHLRDPLRDSLRDRDPLRDNLREPRDRDLRDDPYYRDDPYRRDDPYHRDPERERERDRDRPSLDKDRDRDGRDPHRDPTRDPYSRERGDAPVDRRPPAAAAAAAAASATTPEYLPPVLGKPVDCEILVLNKQQRGYAEMVERRLKTLGISTDMMFVNPEASITAVLDGATRNGALYAVMVSSQHEVHRSLTLNILHGTPQEHRNMPLEDAMNLVTRNYDRYILELREKRGLVASGETTAKVGADGQSAATELTLTQLFSLLADGRQLTLAEVDRVITFLEEMRNRMAEDQGLSLRKKEYPAASAAKPADSTPKQEDLQAKILSLIGSNVSPASVAAAVSKVTSVSSSPVIPSQSPRQVPMSTPNQSNMGLLATPNSQSNLPQSLMNRGRPTQSALPVAQPPARTVAAAAKPLNLDNPTVKKALDNLIQTGPNLLRGISAPQPAALVVQPPATAMSGARGAHQAAQVNPNMMTEEQIARAQAEAIHKMHQLTAPAPQHMQQNIQMAGAASLMAAGINPNNLGPGGMTAQQLQALQAHSMAYSMRGQPPPPPVGPPPGRHMY